MKNIAVIHVIMCRNFKQNCLLLCVHLNGLVELFPWLGDLNVVIHDLGHTRKISYESVRVSLAQKEVERLEKFTHNLHNFSRAKVSRLPVFESGVLLFWAPFRNEVEDDWEFNWAVKRNVNSQCMKTSPYAARCCVTSLDIPFYYDPTYWE